MGITFSAFSGLSCWGLV